MSILSSIRNFFYPSNEAEDILKKREDTQNEWLKIYPDSIKQIEEFLNIFVDAFCTSKEFSFKIKPSDSVNIIYDIIYKNKNRADALEHVFLVQELESHFNIELKTDKTFNTVNDLFLAIKLKLK